MNKSKRYEASGHRAAARPGTRRGAKPVKKKPGAVKTAERKFVQDGSKRPPRLSQEERRAGKGKSRYSKKPRFKSGERSADQRSAQPSARRRPDGSRDQRRDRRSDSIERPVERRPDRWSDEPQIRTQSPPLAPEIEAVRHIEVAADNSGQRLDNYLLRELKGIPRSRVYRLLRRGEVRVNSKRADPEQRLEAGDKLRIPPIRREPTAGAGTGRVPATLIETVRRAIIHEDRDVLVIDKPAGLAAHGGSGIDFGVIEALRADRPEETLELVHRLDRDTSGCLLIARRRSRLRELHALMRESQVEKRYMALVAGQWDLGTVDIDAPLKTRQKQGGERMVQVRGDGKESLSVFRPIQFFGRRGTLMEVQIKTGRTHQIRVHAAHAGHPVAGDEKYGDKEFNQRMRTLGLKRMFLHAQLLSFVWPERGTEFSVNAPLSEELKEVLNRLG